MTDGDGTFTGKRLGRGFPQRLPAPKGLGYTATFDAHNPASTSIVGTVHLAGTKQSPVVVNVSRAPYLSEGSTPFESGWRVNAPVKPDLDLDLPFPHLRKIASVWYIVGGIGFLPAFFPALGALSPVMICAGIMIAGLLWMVEPGTQKRLAQIRELGEDCDSDTVFVDYHIASQYARGVRGYYNEIAKISWSRVNMEFLNICKEERENALRSNAARLRIPFPARNLQHRPAPLQAQPLPTPALPVPTAPVKPTVSKTRIQARHNHVKEQYGEVCSDLLSVLDHPLVFDKSSVLKANFERLLVEADDAQHLSTAEYDVSVTELEGAWEVLYRTAKTSGDAIYEDSFRNTLRQARLLVKKALNTSGVIYDAEAETALRKALQLVENVLDVPPHAVADLPQHVQVKELPPTGSGM